MGPSVSLTGKTNVWVYVSAGLKEKEERVKMLLGSKVDGSARPGPSSLAWLHRPAKVGSESLGWLGVWLAGRLRSARLVGPKAWPKAQLGSLLSHTQTG